MEMFEPYYESWAATMAAKDAYVGDLPQWVRSWMMWMRFAFASSLWFAWTRVEARWAFGVGFSTLYVAAALAYFIGWGEAWGLVHIVLWTPLMIYLIRHRGNLWRREPYDLWVRGLILTIFISLVFDVRDVFSYFVL